MFKDVEILYYHGYDVYLKKFIDLDDFLINIKDSNINPIFSSFSSKYETYEFTGTYSYEEAWNLCYFTMDNGFDNFSELCNQLKYEIDFYDKKVNSYSVSGYVPNVARYLLNIPTSMQNYKIDKLEKVINFYMNFSYSAFIDKNLVINRGVIIINLISYLEKLGYKINLYSFELSKKNNEVIFMIVPLKTIFERVNIKLLYFPLVHPSFLRRLLFRAEEKMPIRDIEWNYGYGQPMKYLETTKFLEYYKNDFDLDNIIYISTPDEMGINGNDINEDFNNCLNILNNKYGLFDKDKVKRRDKYGR